MCGISFQSGKAATFNDRHRTASGDAETAIDGNALRAQSHDMSLCEQGLS
jgi:hypothetical protein